MFLIIYQEIRVIKQTNELTGHTFRVSRSFCSLYIQFPFNPIQLNSIQSNLVLQCSSSFPFAPSSSPFPFKYKPHFAVFAVLLCCSIPPIPCLTALFIHFWFYYFDWNQLADCASLLLLVVGCCCSYCWFSFWCLWSLICLIISRF